MKNRQPAILSAFLILVLASVSCVLFYPSGGALKFEPDALPAARVGVPYEVEIYVTENRTPVGDFSTAADALPPGLELIKVEEVDDTARIQGVPEQAGTYTFTVSVWCYGTNVQGQRGEREYTLTVEE